jgi:nucleoside-diphosphate-sugar epimerase
LAIAASNGTGRARIARLFAFLGPGLPLDAHYAAGNFVRDALGGGPIRVLGDGSPYRSYLYPTDMAAWLLAVFARGGDSRAYNVGSDEAISIAELAAQVARLAGPGVEVARARQPKPDAIPERYVPDTSRITEELQVRRRVSLANAIERTLAFHETTRAPEAAPSRADAT